MKYRLVLLLIITFVVKALHADSRPPEGSLTVNADNPSFSYTFSSEQARHHFLRPFVLWAIEDIDHFPDSETVVFIGSSSIKRWDTLEEDFAPLPVLNRGFGGSTMRDVNVFMDFLMRYESMRIVVYEGDNDLVDDASDIDEDFLDPCRKFIPRWQETLPEAEIYFLSIKPSPARAHATERYREANRRLARLCEEDSRLHFVDVFTPMLDAEGKIRPELYVADGVHLNARGYSLWTRIIRGHLNPSEVVHVVE